MGVSMWVVCVCVGVSVWVVCGCEWVGGVCVGVRVGGWCVWSVWVYGVWG